MPGYASLKSLTERLGEPVPICPNRFGSSSKLLILLQFLAGDGLRAGVATGGGKAVDEA